jgi:hypothetical protein
MCDCERDNGNIRVNGNQLELWDIEYEGWNTIEIKFCPFCGEPKYKPDQKCNFCLNPESIITKGTCCTGCSILSEKKNDR